MEVCAIHEIAYISRDCPACTIEEEKDNEIYELNEKNDDLQTEVNNLLDDIEKLEDQINEADSNRT